MGTFGLHDDLERQLAAFFGKPAALVFSTGYHANLGTGSAMLGPGDIVVIDRDVHASLFDGCRMSGAPTRFFSHNDPDDLAAKLALCRVGAGKLVLVDGVYSMNGDICPLPEIVEVCERFGARLLVDDAHGAGVLGNGRGTCASFGLTDRVDLITLTFSKAFASLGGAVLGSEDAIHFLRHHARTEIFSASITPANAAAASAALRIVESEPWRCGAALDNAEYVGAGLSELGLDVVRSQSPIVSVNTRDASNTMVTWRRLMELGVYVNAVLPPAASPRLRTSYMATHQRHHSTRRLRPSPQSGTRVCCPGRFRRRGNPDPIGVPTHPLVGPPCDGFIRNGDSDQESGAMSAAADHVRRRRRLPDDESAPSVGGRDGGLAGTDGAQVRRVGRSALVAGHILGCGPPRVVEQVLETGRTLRPPARTILEVVFLVDLLQCHVSVAKVLDAPAQETEGKQAGGDQEDAGAPPAEQPPLLVERPPSGRCWAETPENAESDQGQGEQGGQNDPRPGRHALGGAAVGRPFHWIEQPVGPSVVLREHPQSQCQQQQAGAGEYQRSHAGGQQQPAQDLQPDASRLRGGSFIGHPDSMSNGGRNGYPPFREGRPANFRDRDQR